MKNKKLEIIDFSDGIRSNEIQHNFNVIQEEINKERASVGGPGISYGLNCSIKNFTLKIEEGCLIDKNGEDVYIDETIMEIDKPILLEKIERKLTIDGNNRVFLYERPYAANRLTTADNVPVKETGITVNISGMIGETANLEVISVDGNALNLATFNGVPLENTPVDVVYYYTYKRRDVVYIDREFKIKYRKGITSPSPSIPMLDEDEYIYILGYIEVDSNVISEKDQKEYAKARFIKEFKSIRNVYTDDNNRLYLCGTPFDSIKVIHLVEPRNPEEDTFWYDSSVNKLKIWRYTDKYTFVDSITYESINPDNPQIFKTNIRYLYGRKQISIYVNNIKLNEEDYEEGSDLTESQKNEEKIWSNEFRIIKKLKRYDVVTYRIDRYDGYAEWVAINDSSYVSAQERFIWTPEYLDYLKDNCDHDYQYFFFDTEKHRNMLYVPNRNCLEIMIDQIPLHSDQFDEVTLYDAIASENSTKIRDKLVKYYHYKEDMDINHIHEEYENIGIGFKLDASMKKRSYVEAIVTQRVNANPLTKRFQRSATFITEGSVIYNKFINGENGTSINPAEFKTSIPFRYKEHQLEVFLNGRRLENGVEFVELPVGNAVQGAQIDKFKILDAANISDQDNVIYKISTTVYSYDHLEGLLSGFEVRIADAEKKVNDYIEKFNNLKDKVNEYTDEVRGHINTLTNIENTLDNKYMFKSAKIGKDNIIASIYEGTANGVINEIFVESERNERFDVTNHCSTKDFVILTNLSSNKILCRGVDYNLVEEDGSTFLQMISTNFVPSQRLYLTGIRFNRA